MIAERTESNLGKRQKNGEGKLMVCEVTKEETGNKLAPARGWHAALTLIRGNAVRFACELAGKISLQRPTARLQRAAHAPSLRDLARRHLFQIR